jgi:hypothetical protein
MRYLQNVLLVIGALALGASVGGLGMVGYMEASRWPSRGGPDSMGADGLALILLALAAGPGALIGLAAGVTWIMKRESKPWKPRVWKGVAAGIVLGVALHYATKLPRYPSFIEVFGPRSFAAVLTVALAMLCGFVANFAGKPWDLNHAGRDPTQLTDSGSPES